MSWTAPSVPVASTIIAVSWGTVIVDDLIALRASPGNRCDAYNSAAQTVTAGSTTALTLNSESRDTSAMHSTSSNTERITIPAGGAGDYMVVGSSYIASNSNPGAHLHLQKNGSTIKSARFDTSASNLEDGMLHVVKLCVPMAAGDYFNLAGQAVSADCDFGSSTAAYATRLEVIGPLPAA